MLVQFGNNWIQKIPRTAKFFSSNYFQIGQHVVAYTNWRISQWKERYRFSGHEPDLKLHTFLSKLNGLTDQLVDSGKNRVQSHANLYYTQIRANCGRYITI